MNNYRCKYIFTRVYSSANVQIYFQISCLKVLERFPTQTCQGYTAVSIKQKSCLSHKKMLLF